MEIKILGSGCNSCHALEKRVRRVVEANDINADIILVQDIMDIMAYNVMSTPALVVDEEVKAKGRIPKDAEILNWIKA